VLGGSSKLQLQFASAPNPSTPFWQTAHSWRVISLASGNNPSMATFGSIVNGTTAAGTFSTVADTSGIVLTFTPGATPPAPVISKTIVGAGTANATISWSAQSGINYQVQYKDDLNATNWNILGNVTAGGSTASLSDTTGPVPKRFYRVIVP
jgi:hypothetical protein